MTDGFPKLAAIAVVQHKGCVLLVRRRNPPEAGRWGFPGGHVAAGETALAAAERELAEETGVQGKPRGYLTNLDIIQHDTAGRLQFHFLLAVVLCDYIGGTPVAADDVSDARWFTIGDLASLDCSADVMRIAQMAYSTTPTIGPN